MKQAECYVVLQCECPHCGDTQEVEWVDDDKQELSEWTCGECGETFTYAHPGNQYGLAK